MNAFAVIVKLSLATVLFSFVGPVAKLIPLHAQAVTGGRAVFAVFAMALAAAVYRGRADKPAFNRFSVAKLLLCGLLLSGNWFLYFAAVKVSTVAVAVASLFTYPLVTVVLEPLFAHTRPKLTELLAGILAVGCVAIVVPDLSLKSSSMAGMALGVLSGLCFALRNIAVRTFAIPRSVRSMAIEFIVPALLFSPALFAARQAVGPSEIAWMFVLGAVLTGIALLLFTGVLNAVSAGTASIFLSLQPVCSVIIAYVLLGEVPAMRSVVGCALICVIVPPVTWMNARRASGTSAVSLDKNKRREK